MLALLIGKNMDEKATKEKHSENIKSDPFSAKLAETDNKPDSAEKE